MNIVSVKWNSKLNHFIIKREQLTHFLLKQNTMQLNLCAPEGMLNPILREFLLNAGNTPEAIKYFTDINEMIKAQLAQINGIITLLSCLKVFIQQR